jgi:hypothetical protein
VPLFCRHNRLTTSCPICSREAQPDRRAATPAPPPRSRGTARTPAPRRSSGRSGALVTRRQHREADDGYRNALVPGLRATADAERLGAAIAAAALRIEPPGPAPDVAQEPDRDEATWLAFLLALAGPEAPEAQAAVLAQRPSWASGELPDLTPPRERTASAYRAWAQRNGGQAAAFEGDPAWTPQRRFARLHQRLALPGFGRAPRYEMLVILAAAGTWPLEADSLMLGVEEDPTTLAAKRLLVSGDALLLERRAVDLAEACAVPLAALDRALAVWGTPGDSVDLTAPLPPAIGRALALG